eukprot:gene25539-30834_t
MHGFLFLALVCCIISSAVAFHPPLSRRILSQPVKLGKVALKLANDNEPVVENETDEEMMERLRKKARKRMYNEKGVAYAPWMDKTIDVETMAKLMFEEEKGIKKSKGKKTTLDRGEIDTAEGMRYRTVGNQVELGWVTSGEADNQGFIVEKRPSYGGEFREVASYRDSALLASKGPEGGKYKFLDPTTSQGAWIYRVKDCDRSNNINVLCQAFVEVQTEKESKTQAAIAVGFVAVLATLFAVGYSLDPPM